MNLLYFIPIIVGYFVGSIPSGVWYSRLIHREDVRTLGSGNSGGTNIGRNYGLKAAIIVVTFDVLKGWIPMAVTQYFFSNVPWVPMLTGIATVVGHAYPIWANFKGGKVVATSIGVALGYWFWLAIGQVILLFLLIYVTSTVSLSALVSYGTMVLVHLFTQANLTYKIGFVTIFLFLAIRHHENIHRLIHKKENKINWGLNRPNK